MVFLSINLYCNQPHNLNGFLVKSTNDNICLNRIENESLNGYDENEGDGDDDNDDEYDKSNKNEHWARMNKEMIK